MAEKPKAGRPEKPPDQKPREKLTRENQRERFIEAARALGFDETGEEFERLFRKVAAPTLGKKKRA